MKSYLDRRSCIYSLLFIVCANVLYTGIATETIGIRSPVDLVRLYPNGIIDKTPALFGIPRYNQALSSILIYVPPFDGCQPYSNSSVPPEGAVMLIDRGSCFFVTKVRNAQRVGALAVIVVDNVEEYPPYMADDGTASDILIPSLLIRKSDGEVIKSFILNSTVWVTMSWTISRPDNRVEWDYWTSSHDPFSISFKRQFKRAVQALGTSVLLTPHYYIYDGERASCTQPFLPCGNQCTNEGRYCSIDPENDLSRGINGSQVVEENLRQICLVKHINDTDGNQTLWWDYINLFQENCAPSELNFTRACSYAMLSRLKFDYNIIETCVKNSGGFSGVNNLLAREIQTRNDNGVYILPTILVNNAPYRGSLTCPTPLQTSTCGVLQMICNGFIEGELPPACLGDTGCDLGVKRDECGVCGGDGKFDICLVCLSVTSPYFNKTDCFGKCNGDGAYDACGSCWHLSDPNFIRDSSRCNSTGKSSTGSSEKTAIVTIESSSSSLGGGAVAGIVIVSVVVVSGFVYLYMRYQNRKMREDINQMLHQYVPLDRGTNVAPSRFSAVPAQQAATYSENPISEKNEKSNLVDPNQTSSDPRT